MKRRIILSIALVMSIVLVALTSSDSYVGAERNPRYFADTGLLMPGPHRILRITVNGGSGTDTLTVQVRRMIYGQETCTPNGFCHQKIIWEVTSPPTTLDASDAISVDIALPPNSTGFRCVVMANDPNAKMNAQIINTATGLTEEILSWNFGGNNAGSAG